MEPIAVVGFGSVLPGAVDSEEYWHATLCGKSGIYNYDEVDPHFLSDCYSEGEIRPNKTYSRLCGIVPDEILDQAGIRAQVKIPTGYAKIQKMIALALHEAMRNAKLNHESRLMREAHCFLGATPDGIAEYDDALVYQHLEKSMLQTVPAEQKSSTAKDLRLVFGNTPPEQYSPSEIYDRVFADVLKSEVPVVLVDAACSSSLYAIDLAAKSLSSRSCGLVVCGGGFAAGMGNNCMFAQFGGLARNHMRPLDEHAEGTVFSDGTVILLLRRLSDAVHDGNPIYGVIRGQGLSSDGKSPAVNVPTSMGQQLAIDRAYESSGISKESIQYVEAHATGTSGDAVEFNSLKNAFARRSPKLPKIRMGSNKALIGHTGWASGASAVIKLLLALKHHVIPAHYGVNEVNSKFGIDESPFEIPRTHVVWQPNIAGQPRRAAINSFGFGGTNAHLILEEFEPDYHNALVTEWTTQQTSDDRIVVIGENSIFPGEQGVSSTVTTKTTFDGARISLPRGKLVLPDITEHMARAQFLAVMAADQLIESVNAKGVDRSRIGIVFAFNDKCERACAVNLHIYKERILRMIREAVPYSSALEKLILDWYQRFENEHLPTGPYTLAGIMPNVITGRVANLYDLKGPNFVIGDSKGGIFSAVKIAQELIRARNADLVFCGGMHLDPSPFDSDKPQQEGVVMFGLTSVNIAKQYDLTVLAELNVTDKEVELWLNRIAV